MLTYKKIMNVDEAISGHFKLLMMRKTLTRKEKISRTGPSSGTPGLGKNLAKNGKIFAKPRFPHFVRRPLMAGDKPSARALGLSPRVSSFASHAALSENNEQFETIQI